MNEPLERSLLGFANQPRRTGSCPAGGGGGGGGICDSSHKQKSTTRRSGVVSVCTYTHTLRWHGTRDAGGGRGREKDRGGERDEEDESSTGRRGRGSAATRRVTRAAGREREGRIEGREKNVGDRCSEARGARLATRRAADRLISI